MSEPLITKYRPQSFEECIGNELCIKSLSEAVKSDSRPHTYLFIGPSGVGKTTLARIIAKECNAFISEMDAASHSGVDDTRQIVQMAGFKPVNDKPSCMIIIDECHALSKNAWQPLLKLTEEPPDYLYISLCTTEAQKVPETIKTRAYPVSLKALKPFEIEELLSLAIEFEGWKVNDSVFQGVVQAANGSARMALSILQAGHALANRDELSQVIAKVESESCPPAKLANYLIRGGRNWRQISAFLSEIEDEGEAIAIISRSFATAMARSEDEQAKQLFRMLRCFTDTTNWDNRIQLYAAMGKILWGQEIPF